MSLERDGLSFEQALLACRDKLLARARALTENWQDADDLLQEALVKAYGAWAQFRGEASFLTWVQRIMENAHRDQLRRKARLRTVSLQQSPRRIEQLVAAQLAQVPVESGIEREELYQAVQKALDRLSPLNRRILIQKYYLQQSYEELAAAFECSIESIRSRLYRARGEMRRLLLEMEPI